MEIFIFFSFFVFMLVFLVMAIISLSEDSSSKKAAAKSDELHFINMRFDEKMHIDKKTTDLVKSVTNICVLTFTDLELNTSIRIYDTDFFISKEIKITNISDFVCFSMLLKDLSENKKQKKLFDSYGI